MENKQIYYQVQWTYGTGGFNSKTSIVFASGWSELYVAEYNARTVIKECEPPFVRLVVLPYESPCFENCFWDRPVLKGFLDIISEEEWNG